MSKRPSREIVPKVKLPPIRRGTKSSDEKLVQKHPITLLVTAHKGGVGKTTVAHHIAEYAYETGLSVLVVTTDSQTDMARRFFCGSVPPELEEMSDLPFPVETDGIAIWWGPVEEISQLAVSDFDLVVIDTPRSFGLPAAHVDACLILSDGFDALKNNGALVEVCKEKGVPYRQVAWFRRTRDGERLSEWAGKNNADDFPSADDIEQTARRAMPVWQFSESMAAGYMRRLCDEWVRWGLGAGRRRSEDHFQALRWEEHTGWRRRARAAYLRKIEAESADQKDSGQEGTSSRKAR